MDVAAKREPSGEEIIEMFSALANPHRLRLFGLLAERASYVSQLARDVGLSRPLTHIHLQRLEKAGLIEGHLVLSEDGKAMKYFDVTPFSLLLDPDVLARAARTINTEASDEQ